jgi:hypothetical protein
MDDADRELLRETLAALKEAVALFREYEPLLKKLRSPSSIWKR